MKTTELPGLNWFARDVGTENAVIELDDGNVISGLYRGGDSDTLTPDRAKLLAAAPDLAIELERMTALSLELMDRAARIDRALFLISNGCEADYEMGEIIRLREQIGRNRKAFAKAGLEEFDALGGPF